MIEKKETFKEQKMRLRKYTTLELVELDADDEDFDGEVDASERKLRKRSDSGFYTIFDLRDGSHIEKVSKEQKDIFFAACKDNEKKNFLAVKRTLKRREGETRYSLTHESGHHLEDLSRKDIQKLVDNLTPSQLSKFKIVALKEEETFVACDVPEKKKRVSGDVQNHRLKTQVETRTDSIRKDVIVSPDLMPELDTVRVYFDCGNLIDIDSFIPLTARKIVYLCDRGFDCGIHKQKTIYRTEFSCSWYGKMQITREERKFGKNGMYHTPVLSFEYSVAKWYNFTNGINSGIDADAEYLLYPCIQAMCAYELDVFAWDDRTTMDLIVSEFLKRAEIRRFDLSMNFKAPESCFKAREYVNLLSRCRVNRQNSKIEDNENAVCGSVSWGTEKSPYRVIVYDKEAEQKRYFAMRDGRKQIWFEDEKGNKYKRQNSGGTLKECVYDFDEKRKNFYNANKDKFEGVFRYEVQFKTRFMQENHLMTTGKDNINKVLRMGEIYWRDILNRFDEQIGRTNFDASKEREGLAKALDKLSQLKQDGVISRTVYSNMFTFITECLYRKWDVVRDELGKATFSQKYCDCKKLLNYDVKIECPKTEDGLPIMRIMPTLFLNHEEQLMRTFRFVPAPVYAIASGE